MKIIKCLLVGLLVLFFIMPTLSVNMSDQETEEDKRMMELWKELSTPGEHHKYLEYFEGQWEAATKTWMKPGAEPVISKNEIKADMTLGGRFLRFYVKGEMMNIPFEAFFFTGYDNYMKKYRTILIENTATGFYELFGTLDKTGKIRTDIGSWDDMVTGGIMKVKMITKIIDKNKFTFNMFYQTGPYSEEFQGLEMIYTRKQEK